MGPRFQECRDFRAGADSVLRWGRVHCGANRALSEAETKPAVPRRRASDWAAEWQGHNVGERLCDLLLHSDTTPTRFGLALAALFWMIGLLLPGNTVDRPVYRNMAMVAPDLVWALLWSVYSAAMFWRVFTVRTGSVWPFVINAYGLALWGFTSFSIAFALTVPYPAGTAPDFACLAAAFWVFVRTHVFPRGGWRAD